MSIFVQFLYNVKLEKAFIKMPLLVEKGINSWNVGCGGWGGAWLCLTNLFDMEKFVHGLELD